MKTNSGARCFYTQDVSQFTKVFEGEYTCKARDELGDKIIVAASDEYVIHVEKNVDDISVAAVNEQ